jgi:NADPH:quinone reductase
MRAVGLFTHGGPEVLQVVELPEVHAGPGQVRIQVHAATVNPTDVGARNGARAEQQKVDPPPYVPGMEAGGIVDEIGSGVPDRLKLGDAVMAIVVPKGSHGAYREQIVLDARSVVRAPAGKTHPEACSLPMNGLTARQSLDLLKLSPGQVIAVTGAAGAYGGYVVQLAKAEGLTVIADASEKDEQLVASLGADLVVRRGNMLRRAFEDISLKESMGSRTERCSMNLSSPPFVMAASLRPSADSRAFRRGISTSPQLLCALTHRSSRSSIGYGNRSKSARSPFA